MVFLEIYKATNIGKELIWSTELVKRLDRLKVKKNTVCKALDILEDLMLIEYETCEYKNKWTTTIKICDGPSLDFAKKLYDERNNKD
jgi:hypothetical protein